MCDLCGSGGCEKSTSVKELGTLSRRPEAPEAAEYLRSPAGPASGGSSMPDGPWWGERPDTDEVSESRDGVPSADRDEKADGEGRGVST